MNLETFHQRIRIRIQEEMDEIRKDRKAPLPIAEDVYAQMLMEKLQDVGMVDNYELCYWTGKIEKEQLAVSGYALSSDETRLDLLITRYTDVSSLEKISAAEIKKSARLAMNFILNAATRNLLSRLDPSSDVFQLVELIQSRWDALDQIQIIVLTDGQTESKKFHGSEVNNKLVRVEVIDIERFSRHENGYSQEEIQICFESALGAPLDCIHVPDPKADYEYALAVFPGELIRKLYEDHNTRLLEANVRTFLGARGKVNIGIQKTLEQEPEHFMAFNNGLVVICDNAEFFDRPDGSSSIKRLKGLQIVNGGQTTSSLYFAKRKNRNIDLSHVRVPVKIIIPKENEVDQRDSLVQSISRYANSQNTVKTSDLSANRPFHVQLEKLSMNEWLPNASGRWFYERANGTYNVLLMREGTTAAKRAKIKKEIPANRKLAKNDIARLHEAWRQRPSQVALGGEKNHVHFMAELDANPSLVPDPLTPLWYHSMIGKAIMFQSIQKLIKSPEAKLTFRQSQINISSYLLSLVSYHFGEQIDFDAIWRRQELTEEFKGMLYSWAEIVNQAFIEVSNGKQFGEVAKRPELWVYLKTVSVPMPIGNIPEITPLSATDQLAG